MATRFEILHKIRNIENIILPRRYHTLSLAQQRYLNNPTENNMLLIVSCHTQITVLLGVKRDLQEQLENLID